MPKPRAFSGPKTSLSDVLNPGLRDGRVSYEDLDRLGASSIRKYPVHGHLGTVQMAVPRCSWRG